MRDPQGLGATRFAANRESLAARKKVLTAWAAGKLKQTGKRLPPSAARRLQRDPAMDALLESDAPETRSAFLNAARGYLAEYRSTERRERKSRKGARGGELPTAEEVQGIFFPGDQALDPGEALRLDVLTRALGRIANKLPDTPPTADETEVGSFRSRFFNGKTISGDAATTLLRSEALFYLEAEFFESRGIPFEKHTSRLVTPGDREKGVTAESAFEITWGEDQSLTEAVGERTKHFVPTFRPHLRGVHLDSLRNSLECAAISLAGRFPWPVDAARWFILTGKIPEFPAIWLDGITFSRTPYHELMRIQLTIHPWLSAKTVLRAYQQIQHMMIGHRNRPPRRETLQFFDFVSQQRDAGVSWMKVMKAWRRKSPRGKEKYREVDEATKRRFSRDFKDIESQILWPFEHGQHGYSKVRGSRTA